MTSSIHPRRGIARLPVLSQRLVAYAAATEMEATTYPNEVTVASGRATAGTARNVKKQHKAM